MAKKKQENDEVIVTSEEQENVVEETKIVETQPDEPAADADENEQAAKPEDTIEEAPVEEPDSEEKKIEEPVPPVSVSEPVNEVKEERKAPPAKNHAPERKAPKPNPRPNNNIYWSGVVYEY